MGFSATRRDVAVGAVAAVVGGCVVAGALVTLTSLKEARLRLRVSYWSSDAAAARQTCLLTSYEQKNRKAQTEDAKGVPTDQECPLYVVEDGLEAESNPFGSSVAQNGRNCDGEACCCNPGFPDNLDQDSVMSTAQKEAGSCDKYATLRICNTNMKADPFDPSKRKGYLSWDDYFMAIAFLSAQRSKDPNRQVRGILLHRLEHVLVSQDQVILGIGYNGFPRGCSDDELPWAKMSVDGDALNTKYPYVCHAEVNAILNKNHASAAGQRLYVTMFPCNECAKVIIQAQIAEVVYFTEKGQGQSKSLQEFSFAASRKLLSMAGVKAWQYKPLRRWLLLQYR